MIAAQLEAFADHVAESSLIYFPDKVSVDDAWGETRTTLDERCRYAVGIGSLLADVICQPQWHKISAQSRRYYNFQLADTLVHELAHVAWRCRRWDELLQQPNTESDEALISPNEQQIELGQSWENWFFGGELQPIDTFEIPPRWLGFIFVPFTRDTGNEDSIAYQDCGLGGHAITAASVNQFFQKDRWADHLSGEAPFSIELTPLNSLTNDHWDGNIDGAFMNRMSAIKEGHTRSRP